MNREEYDNGMKYVNGDLWRFIQQFKELGDFPSNAAAQEKLAEKLENIPLKYLLNEQLILIDTEKLNTQKKEKNGLTI